MMTGFGMGLGGLGLIVMLLFVGVVVAGGAGLVSMLGRSGNRSLPPAPREMNAREILDQRYARGELDREQYESMKSDLQ